MNKALLLIFLLLLLLCSGCELFYQEEPLGSIHAIYVGLNYHGTDVNYLEGTLNDAQELDQCLASLSSNQHRIYTSYPLLQKGGPLVDGTGIRFIFAYDSSDTFGSLPTKSKVLGQIRALHPHIADNDLTIFSFSGHGIQGGSLVLASPDCYEPTIYDEDTKLKEGTLLGVSELLDALAELPGKKLLILDSCYCGSFVEESGSSVSLIDKSRFLHEAFETYFSSREYNPSLFVLAATTSDNTSKEMPASVPDAHGYFTKALLDGLGWDHTNNTLPKGSPAMKKRVLTTDSLYAYVLENQDYPSQGLFPSQYQHPTISGGAYSLRIF